MFLLPNILKILIKKIHNLIPGIRIPIRRTSSVLKFKLIGLFIGLHFLSLAQSTSTRKENSLHNNTDALMYICRSARYAFYTMGWDKM